MGLASDISKLGLTTLAGINGISTGNLLQDGTSTAFAGATITSRTRTPAEGSRDREAAVAIFPASGIALAPRADGRVTFTGIDAEWRIVSSDPFSPGGTVIAWRVSLENFVQRAS